MIDGFKLTVTGEELRSHLSERVDCYRARAQRTTEELEAPDPRYPLPKEMLKHDIRSAEQRADAFAFMREHIVEGEVYLLGRMDLECAELLPPEEEETIPAYMYRR